MTLLTRSAVMVLSMMVLLEMAFTVMAMVTSTIIVMISVRLMLVL